MKHALSVSLLMLVLTGCSLMPNYERPVSPVASSWLQSEADDAAIDNAMIPTPSWHSFFHEPQLRDLIAVALENNRDLRVAALNAQATRALYRVQRAERLPSVSAEAGGSRTRAPYDFNGTTQNGITSQYSATLGVAWELDLFGRVGSLQQQALEEYLATEAAQQSVKISLIASVANTYLLWQADSALLQATRDTLDTFEDSLRLTQRSFDVGIASSLELTQARTAVETARSSLAAYTRRVGEDRNALDLLLGQHVPVSPAKQPQQGTSVLAALPIGLSSDALLQRPDILQAEYQLRGASANIGAARAAFFPSISLTANAGSASSQLSGLFDSGSEYWNFSPSISLPIFSAGRLQANLDYAELIRDVRIAEYDRAIQIGFSEVADGLAARQTYVDQVAAQQSLLDASEDYFQIAERRYRSGVDSYLTLLDAQRQLFSARQQLITDRLNQTTSEVDLFRALGGGWSNQAE